MNRNSAIYFYSVTMGFRITIKHSNNLYDQICFLQVSINSELNYASFDDPAMD